jgi:hypothetical protein
MIYFVTGASGAGKAACIPYLKKLLPNIKIFDFDEVGVPENADKIWRQKSTEYWLQISMGVKWGSGIDLIKWGSGIDLIL